MSDERDEKFFDVLAGRRVPDDVETRRAARMRQYFEMHPSLEEQPRDDPQGELKLIAYLRARVAAAPAPVAAVGRPGLLRQAVEWLFPAGAGRSMSWGMAAAALLGAVLVLRLIEPASDDSATIKSLPPIGAATETVRSAEPAKAAAEVQALLSANGVAATVTPQERDVLLRAEVAPDRREVVAQGLAALGLTLPADGRLSLRFSPP